MSVNLISLASQYLTPEILTKIGSALGLDRSLIGKACSAALPALLGRFANLASTPDGARKLHDAASNQSTNILEDLAGAITGPGHQSWMENGIRSLSSLLGSSSLSALAGSLGKFAGIGQSSGSSLLGMIAPIVMAVLGKQSAENRLDSSGLAQLLASQKDNIAAAMPAGFKEMIQSPSAAAGQAPRWSPSKPSSLSPGTLPSSSARSAWPWILPVIALGAVAWWALSNQTSTTTEQTKPASATTEQTKPASAQLQESVAVAGVDLKSSTQKAIDGITATLQNVKDESSAQAAVPQLRSAASELDNVIKLADQLPAAGKKTLSGIAAAAQPAATQLFDKVLAIPGAKEVAKPHLDALRAKIDTLSKNQARL